MIVCHVITGLGGGGAETALFRLCTSEPDLPDRHVVISLMSDGIYAERLRAAGVEVYSLKLARGQVTVRALLSLQRLLARVRPDLVQTWMYHADLIGGWSAFLRGLPVVWNVRHANLDDDMHSRSTLRVARLCAWCSWWLPARIVTCSQAAIPVHDAHGYDREKFCVIPNGYPSETFAAQPDLRARGRSALALSEEDFVVGMAARYHPLKDHACFLAALRVALDQGAELVCLLTGPGVSPDNQELGSQIRALGLADHVRLLGTSEGVVPFMNVLDLHVLSSVSEGFPNVLAEAMACETPCVTTDCGDARTIVGNEGWVVAPRDPQALGRAMAEAYRLSRIEPTAWSALRSSSRARVAREFSIAKMVAGYRDVWRSVLARDGKPS